ncbi:MAG: alpha/beta hydrolase [Nitrospiraceae bacterium]|nr:alpha/beta hydrolase [Nitrospiraceae bacterium]
MAGDLALVLDTLDTGKVTLVCHSGAGGEAIRYCSRYGVDRIARIVLVAATGPRMMATQEVPGVTRTMLDMLCQQLAGDLAGWIDQNIEPFTPGVDRRTQDWMAMMVMDSSRRAITAFQRTIVEADLAHEAVALRIPVTIIHGTCDVSAPIEMTGYRYADLIQESELIVYEGAAHGLMVTHATRLAEDVARAVAR